MRNSNFFALVLCLCFVAIALAQVGTGSLNGTVSDPAGAAVPGATVRVVHDDTGVATTAVTTDAGTYTFPTLPVGPYTIDVEKSGFKKTVRSGVVIATATRSALDLHLEVGQVSESVNVTAEAPLLQSTSSDIGTSFAPKFMKDAPLFVSGGFRNPENFVTYLPGVNGSAQDTSVNGGSRRSKEILIDGASHTNPESGGTAFAANGGVGSVEMFGEFKLLTSNFSAEYGRSGGGIEIFVTKSGTNQIHGTAFDFLRNDKLDAAGWSVNSRRPFLGKSKLRQNEFGGAVGGPVYIPKLYDGRNKTFFFFTYNGYRQNAGGGTAIATVPTALMKKGDFSELGSRLIYDPATTATVNGVITRQAFPNNQIPTARFSSVSQKMLGLIPDPTSPGISNNFSVLNKSTVEKDVWSIKGDHAFSDKNRLSGFYTRQALATLSEGGLPGALANGQQNRDKPDTSRVNHTYTFTPSLLNYATFGLSRYQNIFTQLPQHVDTNWPQTLGLKGVLETPEARSFPIVNFTTDSLTKWGNDPKTSGSQFNWTYTVTDTLTWIRGKHEFKTGYEYIRGRTFQDPLDCAYCQGLFNFSNGETALPTNRATTGYAFASFLLGGVDSARRDFNTKGVDNKFIYHGLFINDNIRMTSRLTLNLGLRWEIFVPRTETNLTLSAFDPTIPNPAAGNLLGALSFAGTGPGRNGRVRFGDIYKDNLGPRIGFAYQLTQKTVLRGGYGMYFSAANGNTGGGCFPCGWGTSASPTPTTIDQYTPVFNWDQGFQTPPGFVPPPIIDPSYANGQTVLALSKEDGLAGRIQNWSFNVQHELPAGFLIDIAYVGTKGSRLNNYVAMNQVDPKYLSLGPLLSKSITDPEVVAKGYKKPYDSFTGTLAQALRPYPQYNNIIHTYLGKGGFNYNSLQAKVEKRYSALTLLAAYTWSKNMSINGAYTQTGNGIAPQDAYNTANEKALSIHDIPHVLNLVYTLDLPFGKGRKYLSATNPFVRSLVGGWTIAGLHQYRSGSLIQIGAPSNTLGPGVLFTPALRANTTGKAIRTDVDRTKLDPNDPTYRWLNRDAFDIPGPYQFGSAAPFLNDVRNPPFFTESLSLVKRTTFTGEVGRDLEIGADVSNLFNRTMFGGVNVNLADPNFGRVTGVQSGPRVIQLRMRLNF
jgi:hypothetical protein